MCNRCGGHDTGSVTVSPSEASRGHFRKEQKRERYLCSPTDKIKTYPTDCWLRNAVRGHAQTFYYYAKRHERKKISSGREPQLKDFYYPIGLALVAEKTTMTLRFSFIGPLRKRSSSSSTPVRRQPRRERDPASSITSLSLAIVVMPNTRLICTEKRSTDRSHVCTAEGDASVGINFVPKSATSPGPSPSIVSLSAPRSGVGVAWLWVRFRSAIHPDVFE
jgi:hypothetical protein